MEILEKEVPLRIDESGAVRVGDTRVLFELVIRSYLRGHTPEEIVRQYTTLTLADTYGAIAYFLAHRDQVEEYLQEREEGAREMRETLEDAGVAVNVSLSQAGENSS
ncbi:MAG: hypothetical protein BRD55_08685 [Bacteroidetes bacterium SW_9_63_38]|nr:MAG: hypothetical protein BRD55_08685 [Bacteroidetes bacterium SW_9_63_38]